MQSCSKCHSQLMLRNDELVCIFCPGKKQGQAKEGHVAVQDPGEGYFVKTGETVKYAKSASNKGPNLRIAQSATAKDALDVMKSLPMPDDIKQFKQIKRIIASIEKLIEVQNDN